MKGAVFFYVGYVLRPFVGSHFWNKLFTVFGPILGVMFVTLLSFFRSWASLGRSSVFEGLPMRNASLLGARRPRNHEKGSPEGGPKMDPKKDTKQSLFGVGFGTVFGLLGLPWGTLLLSCCLLAPGAQKGRPKSSLREAKSCPRAAQERPREAQGRPRGSQKCPRRARGRPKRAPERPREAQDRPKRDQDRPRQAKTGQESPKERPREPTTA